MRRIGLKYKFLFDFSNQTPIPLFLTFLKRQIFIYIFQITCEVIKTREDFYEPGYEFIPSTYVNTTCVAKRTCDPSFNDNSGRKQVSTSKFCKNSKLQLRINTQLQFRTKVLRHTERIPARDNPH